MDQKPYFKIFILGLLIIFIKFFTHSESRFICDLSILIYLFVTIIYSVRYNILCSIITLFLNITAFIFINLLSGKIIIRDVVFFSLTQIFAVFSIRIAEYYYLSIKFKLKENRIYLDAITTFNYIKIDDKNIDNLLDLIENEYSSILDSKTVIIINSRHDKDLEFIENKLNRLSFLPNQILNAKKSWIKRKNIFSENAIFFKKWQWFILGNKEDRVGVIGIEIALFEIFINSKKKKLIYELIKQATQVIKRSLVYKKDSQAQEANYKLSMAILSSISHDLKTPLTSIIGSLSAVRYLGSKLSKETRNCLILEAEEEAVQLNRFISNLLNMIKLQSGEVQLNLEWIDPNEIIRSLLKRMQFKSESQIKYIPQNNDIMFKLDAILIEQVLQNILENALKAAPNNSEIIIKSYIDNESRGCFSIEDYGPGIPINMRNQVFKKFFSVQHFESQTPGSGLGLAICNTIVEAHNGCVTIENNNNSNDTDHPGTVFTIFLPETKKLIIETNE